MITTSRTSGLAALGVCAVTLAFACTSQTEATGDDADPAVGGGTADGGGAVQITTTGLPCAVSEVLSQNCQTCHAASPKAGASTSLVTWDDLQKDHGGRKLYELVKERIHAETGRMPPAARLTDAQVKSIDDWVAGGATQASDSCNVGEGPPPATREFNCPAPGKVTVLKPAKPFTWTDSSKTDQYMCFGADEVAGAKRHIIGLGPQIENLNIVHHILVYQAQESVSSELHPCESSATWKLIAEWAPGGGNLELPPEAGFPQEGTTHWALQVHYNNATGKHSGESDSSGYQLCSTDQLRPNDAGILGFGTMKFTIPPRTPKYTLKCDYKLGDKYKGVKLFGASPHMHTRGTAVVTERIPGGKGTPEPIFGQDPFNFENQDGFEIDKAVEPGDVMRTRCSWKNPGDTEVTFGEKTSDEMCFNFFTYYPAIPDKSVGGIPTQFWATPSMASPFGGGVECTQEE